MTSQNREVFLCLKGTFFLKQKIAKFAAIVVSLIISICMIIPANTINSIAQDLQRSNPNNPTYQTKNEKGIPKLELNENYKSPGTHEADLETSLASKPAYETGSALDPSYQLSELSDEARNSSEKETKSKPIQLDEKGVIDKLKNATEDKEKATDTKKEYILEDGSRLVQQKLFSSKILNEKGEKVELDTSIQEKQENGEIVLSQGNGRLKPVYKEISKNGITVNTPVGAIAFQPLNAQISQPAIESNAVVYKNVWKDVDLVYEYKGDAVKEYMVLQKKPRSNSFAFRVNGAELSNSKEVNNGIDLKVGDTDLHIEPLYIKANKIGPVTEDISKQSADKDIITIEFDQKWLDNLKDENYPVSVDPGVIYGSRNINNPNGNVVSYKSDGYVCPYLSCDLNTGALQNNGLKSWRAVAVVDYSEIMGANKNLLDANIFMPMSTNWWNNNYNWNQNTSLYVTHAACWGHNCITGAPQISATFTQNGNIPALPLLNFLGITTLTVVL